MTLRAPLSIPPSVGASVVAAYLPDPALPQVLSIIVDLAPQHPGRREMAAHVARLTRPRFGSRVLLLVASRVREVVRWRREMRPPTDYGERILARERDTGGHPIIATTLAMYHHPGPHVTP